VPKPWTYIALEPPPSRFIPSFAPSDLSSAPTSEHVMPAATDERPSTTTMKSLFLSADRPMAQTETDDAST